MSSDIDKDYLAVLNDLKQKIKSARIKSVLAVNRELIFLYWQIGSTIIERQGKEGWGTRIIDRLSKDLKNSFPDVKGFSVRNLKYMRKFASVYTDITIVQEVLAQITWYHNIALMDKIESPKKAVWYAQKTVENGWSRNVLVHQIEGELFNRQASIKKTTNFGKALVSPDSELAQQMIKDPYKLDFLGIGEKAKEKEIEYELVKHMKTFLLELGKGFAFVGQQYHISVGEQDFYIDLLFYHLNLRCYVVIELKAGTFKPSDVGQLNFYLSVVDDSLKHKDDKPTIGILLCKDKNNIVAEYALRDTIKPMGIAEYKLSKAIPKEMKTDLPGIEELEKELKDDL